MWKATRGGHELKHLGLISALRSANLCVRAKLNRGAVSLGTDASRRATELRSPPRRSGEKKATKLLVAQVLCIGGNRDLRWKSAAHNPTTGSQSASLIHVN